MHDGHRQRMYKKLCNGENLFDHEVLEILLYSVYPRVNTNPIAHALLNRFCSLSEVFAADAEELKSVEGVGDGAANFLKTVGCCIDRCGKVEGVALLKNTEDCKKLVSMRFKGKTEEFLELYFMEKNGRVKRVFSYTSADRNKVETNAQETIRNIALCKPYAMLAAHNHINGCVQPSHNDIIFTQSMQLICSMNNVKFWDHLIYSDAGGIYSFKNDGALDGISRKFSVDGIMKWIKNSDL